MPSACGSVCTCASTSAIQSRTLRVAIAVLQAPEFVELQVVMRIDQARQQPVALQVDHQIVAVLGSAPIDAIRIPEYAVQQAPPPHVGVDERQALRGAVCMLIIFCARTINTSGRPRHRDRTRPIRETSPEAPRLPAPRA